MEPMDSLSRILVLACLLLPGLGCRRALVRPERLDGAAMRAWIAGNFSPLEEVEISWRGLYQDEARTLPFRLDLDWRPGGARLSLRSPFGGELASLSCGQWRVEDPALAPLLAALAGLPPDSHCRRATLAPWLWGEWIPPAGAAWRAEERLFRAAEGTWRVATRCGLVERVEGPAGVVELDQFTREAGVWLPGRMRLERPGGGRLVLQRREARLSVAARR